MLISIGQRGSALLTLWILVSFGTSSGFQKNSAAHLSSIASFCNRYSDDESQSSKPEVLCNDDISSVLITSERKQFSQTVARLIGTVLLPYIAEAGFKKSFLPAVAAANDGKLLRIPLSKYDGVFCMNYTVNGNQYRGIVDTGSPFLIVPSVDTTIWGFTAKNAPPYLDSGLSMTTEIFGGQDYETYWRVGDLKLSDSNMFKKIVFANVGEDIMRPPGGVFVGLIKYKAKDIRPTLLGQMKYSSIQFDSLNKELLLSRYSLINSVESKATTIKMVDLRVLGDPVYHYAARIKVLEINGRPIAANSTIYAVFDTGTTGCVLSDDLMNDYETPNPIRKVRVVLQAENGDDIIIETGATRDEIFVVTAAKIPWFTKNSEDLKNYFDDTTVEKTTRSDNKDSTRINIGDDNRNNVIRNSETDIEDDDDEIISANIARRLLMEPQVVVIGLAFFKNKILTIDIDEGRLSLLPSKLRE